MLTDKAKREQYKKAKRINKRNIHIKTKTRGIFAAQIMPIHKQKHGYKIAPTSVADLPTSDVWSFVGCRIIACDSGVRDREKEKTDWFSTIYLM